MAFEDRPYYRDEPPRFRMNVPMPGPVTMAVMGACLAIFIVVNVFGVTTPARYAMLDFRGGLAFRQPWRLLTYAYVHGTGSHIFWNLLSLYFFLPPLESAWGPRRAFIFYTLGTLAAALTFGIMCAFYPFGGLIGASGGALAALGACAYLFPQMMIFMVIPIRVMAALIGILYLLSIAGDKDPSDAAHLGGLAFGFFWPYYGRTLGSRWSGLFERKRRVRSVASDRAEQEMIDRILEKVHQHGMNSLSWTERRALKKATERQRRAEMARARRAG